MNAGVLFDQVLEDESNDPVELLARTTWIERENGRDSRRGDVVYSGRRGKEICACEHDRAKHVICQSLGQLWLQECKRNRNTQAAKVGGQPYRSRDNSHDQGALTECTS